MDSRGPAYQAMNPADQLCEAGTIKMARGEAGAALSDYDAALQLDPCHLLVRVNRGIVLAALGRHAEAEADFSCAIAIDPKSDHGWYERGLFYAHLGKLTRAIADFDRALQRNPASSAAYFNRGVSRLKQGKPEQAFRDFEHTLLLSAEEDPNRSDAHHLRGLILRDQGKLVEALAEVDASVRLAPGDLGKLYSRARMYLALEAWEKAILDFSDCLAAKGLDDRTQADALIDRSSAWIATGWLSRGIADLDAALALAPEDPIALFNRGEAHEKSGRRDLAARDFRRLLELRPENAEVRDRLKRIESSRVA